MKESIFAILKFNLKMLIIERAGLMMGMTLMWGLLTLVHLEYSCSTFKDMEESKDTRLPKRDVIFVL